MRNKAIITVEDTDDNGNVGITLDFEHTPTDPSEATSAMIVASLMTWAETEGHLADLLPQFQEFMEQKAREREGTAHSDDNPIHTPISSAVN